MRRFRTWWRASGSAYRWSRGVLALLLLGWLGLGAAAVALYSLLRSWLSGWIPPRWFSGNVEDWLFGAGATGDARNYIVFLLAGLTAFGCCVAVRWAFLGGVRKEEPDQSASGKTQAVARNRVFGTNRIKKHIGRGSSSEVYLGESETGQQVAVKVFRNRLGQMATATQAVSREYEVLLQLRSGGVANLVSSGLEDAQPWIATEYIEGLSLREYIELRGPMGHVEARALLYRLAGILAELQEQGAAHRDLSPNNVILGRQGPVLVDFGLGRIDLDHSETGSYLVHGTEGYAAPETIKGESVGTPADVYALSQIQSFILTGEGPKTSNVEPLKGVEGDVLQRAADQDPRHRPNASELVEILRCNTDGLFERLFEARELLQLPRRTSPLSLGIAAIVPLVATVGIGWMFWPESDELPSSEALATAVDSLSTVGVVELELDGGFFSSLPQPVGWSYSSIDPGSAYYRMIGTSGKADRVLEAYEFTGSQEAVNALLIVVSFENKPYVNFGEEFGARFDEKNLFHRVAGERMDQINVSSGTECSLIRPSNLLIRDRWHFMVATTVNDACNASESRWYIAGFQPGSELWVEILARTDNPISPLDILDKLAFSDTGPRFFRQGDRPLDLLQSAGWESTSAVSGRLRDDPSAVFSAVAVIPPMSGVIIRSELSDPTIYEATAFFEGGLTLNNGQWFPFNALSEISEVEWHVTQQPRNHARFHNFDPDNSAYLIVRAERATVTAKRVSDLTDISAAVPSAEFLQYFSLKDDSAALQLARDSLFTLSDFGKMLETLPAIFGQNLDLKTLIDPAKNKGKSQATGLPLILNEYGDGTYDAPDDSWFGPEFLKFPVGTVSVIDKGDVKGDLYFEGTKQFLDNRDREYPFANRLRLYFGEAALLKFGDPNDWHIWGGTSGCGNVGVWEINDQTENLRLYIGGYINCKVSILGGSKTTLAPYLRFALVRLADSDKIQDVPVVMGDYVLADAWDPLHLRSLIEVIALYMVEESTLAGFLAPDGTAPIDLACFEFSLGMLAMPLSTDKNFTARMENATSYFESAANFAMRVGGELPALEGAADAIVRFNLEWKKVDLDFGKMSDFVDQINEVCLLRASDP